MGALQTVFSSLKKKNNIGSTIFYFFVNLYIDKDKNRIVTFPQSTLIGFLQSYNLIVADVWHDYFSIQFW